MEFAFLLWKFVSMGTAEKIVYINPILMKVFNVKMIIYVRNIKIFDVISTR